MPTDKRIIELETTEQIADNDFVGLDSATLGTRKFRAKDMSVTTDFVPATDSANGEHGLVPAPVLGMTNYVLANQGWTEVENVPTENSKKPISSGAVKNVADNIPTQLSQLSDDSTHRLVTDTEKSTWNNKSDFSGSYNDLTDTPTIPDELADLSDDSTHRLVTDSEKTEWNAKANVEANPLGPATADLHKILVDDTIYSIPDVVVYGTASGAIASFDDGGNNKPLKSLKVAINPVQASGTPTPENPIPISGWFGVNVHNYKVYQICKATDSSYTSNGLTITYEGKGKYRVRGQMSSNASTTLSINFTEFNIYDGEDSYIALNNTFSYASLYLYLQYGTTNIEQWGFTANYRTSSYTGMRGKAINRLTLVVPSTLYGTDIDFTFKIELYSNDNKYIYPITWSEAGEVFGGYIDYERKKLVINRAEYNITSTRNLTQNGADIIAMNVSSKYQKDVIPLCECFEGIIKGYSSGLSANQCRFNNSLSAINFRFSANKTVDEWKAELANNPIQLILGLVEPIEFDLDEPVPSITTILRDNNIWSDTGDVLECVYQRDLNLAINELFSRIEAIERTGSTMPVVPTSDGTYDLKATVTSGSGNVTWVAEEPSPEPEE